MSSKLRVVSIGKQSVTVTTAGTAVPVLITSDPNHLYRYCPDFIVYNNNSTGNIYVGDDTVDDTWIPIAPGTSLQVTHGTGSLTGEDPMYGFDLSKIYVDSDDDGATAIVQFVRGKIIDI